MSYLSHLYLPGAVALWAAVIFALASIWGYAQVMVRASGAGSVADASSMAFARRAYDFFAISIGLVAVVLATLLALRDFRIEYVYQYSGLDLAHHFQLAAFWAGQKGSFLIWLLWGALLGLGVKRTAGKAEAPVMGIYVLTLLGLLFILVRENPFVMLEQASPDGAGLNPLLQDNWMVIHPPIMFVGYALSAVPFAFAMAALLRGDYSTWAARAFPWALAGFLVLGTAILMGGYWAYKTLGWGGYWGWDPVENASLIPWLFGTVMIHGLHLERTKNRYRRINFVLAWLTYLSVLYGTFLTRSGVLADFSVHSFVDLGISGWLIALMVVFGLAPLVLFVTRLRRVPTERNEDPPLSRGMFMVLSTITITVSALVITAGTSAPLLTRFLENPGQVGPEFYNQVNLPIALLVALLLAFIPYLTWRGTPARELLKKLLIPGAVTLVATGVVFARGVHDPFHLLFFFLAALALLTNLLKTIALARSGGLRASGGYLAHVGVGIILLGILASSGYDHSTKVTLEQGKVHRAEDLSLTFVRFVPRIGQEKERMEIRVERAGGKVYYAYPKMFLNDRTKQLMVNPDVHSLLLQDLYISPIEFDPGQPGVQLAKGESGRVGELGIKFIGFDLQAEGNALMKMQAGEPMTIGADVEVTQGDVTRRLKPLYRMNPQTGQVDTPPVPLPGGGSLYVAGINASAGGVQLAVEGRSTPAKLSVDVTRKPLIALVWYGLYVVLAGGLLATVARFRQAMKLDAAPAVAGGGPGGPGGE